MHIKLCIILLITLMTTACATKQAAFLSTPPGAVVTIDGEEIGVTPCSFDYKLSSSTSHQVTIAKEGFDSVNFVVKADETDVAARSRWLVAGAVWSPLWIGTAFTKKLKDSYDFALLAEPPQMTAAAASATPSGL